MITNINEFKLYLENKQTEYLHNFTVTKKQFSEFFIISILDYYFNNVKIDLNILQDTYLDILKKETIEYINKVTDGENILYRGISGNYKYGDSVIYDKCNSWSLDEETAKAFIKNNGVIIKQKIDFLNILFSMDVFIDSIPNEIFDTLPIQYQHIINGYVSESEVIIKHCHIIIGKNNSEFINNDNNN